MSEQQSFNEQSASAQGADVAVGRFRLIDSGTDALVTRVRLADVARQQLDLQYYIAHDGLTTRLLAQRIFAAADRGVKVRILLDALTSRGQEHRLARLDSHDNIEIRFFNPLPGGFRLLLLRFFMFLFHFRRMHRRMHNKLWLVDGKLAITGGRNLGDEYYGAHEDMNFADLDVLAAGVVARQMQQCFEGYWNSASSVPLRRGVLSPVRPSELRRWRLRLRDRLGLAIRRNRQFVDQARRAHALLSAEPPTADMLEAPFQFLADPPEKISASDPGAREDLIYRQLFEHMSQVESELVIVSAYFIPGEAGVRLLASLVQRGVRVQVLTNSLAATDLPLVHGGYANYRRALLAAGVELYEMRARAGRLPRMARLSSRSSLHSKALVFDRQQAFVGTFNMDPRSALWNTEMGVLMHSRELSGQVISMAQEAMQTDISFRVELAVDGRLQWHFRQGGEERVRRREKGGLWRHFLAWFARHFVTEELL